MGEGGCSMWSAVICCGLLLGMRLGHLVWRRGRRDEEVKIPYMLLYPIWAVGSQGVPVCWS